MKVKWKMIGPAHHELCCANGKVLIFDEGSEDLEWGDVSRRYRGIDRLLVPMYAALSSCSISLATASLVSIEDVAHNIVTTGLLAVLGIAGNIAYHKERVRYNPLNLN